MNVTALLVVNISIYNDLYTKRAKNNCIFDQISGLNHYKDFIFTLELALEFSSTLRPLYLYSL